MNNAAFKSLLTAGMVFAACTAQADTKIGFIGSMSSDTGLSTLRGAQMAIDEINAGGLLGEQVSLVTADTGQDPTEGIRAFEYLVESEEVDFVISGSIDDVSLAWIPRMVEYQVPTLDTWTSYVGIIDMVIEDPEGMAPYFMNIATDEGLATLYLDFGRDILKEKMGWDSVVLIREDTAFGEAIGGFVSAGLKEAADIELAEEIVYDIGTIDFAPIFSRAQASGADFIYVVSSVNSQVISSQYVQLQVPMALTGLIVAAMGQEFWEDTDGQAGGISTLSPVPVIGMKQTPEMQAFLDAYQSRYESRPKVPHFNGYNAYFGMKQAFAAAEEVGGFNNSTWVAAMKRQDLDMMLDGERWMRYAWWGDDEVEPRTGRTYPHNTRFDITPPYDDATPSMMVVQWYENGENAVIYPEKYATGEFILPSWIKP